MAAIPDIKTYVQFEPRHTLLFDNAQKYLVFMHQISPLNQKVKSPHHIGSVNSLRENWSVERDFGAIGLN